MRSPLTLYPEDATVRLPGFHATRTWRPGGLELRPHTHDHTNVSLCVGGSFDESLRGRWHRVTPASLICRPGGEPHANRYSRGNSRAVIFEVAAATLSTVGPFSRVLETPLFLEHPTVAGFARRVDEEFTRADSVSALVLEGLAYELIAFAARHPGAGRPDKAPWMTRVRDLIHAEFRRSLTIDEIAATAGVHPGHLSRTFRAQYSRTIGDYVRDLRLSHGAWLLRNPGVSLVEVSAECGFYDQSHFTRAFTRRFGVSPARYRKLIAN